MKISITESEPYRLPEDRAGDGARSPTLRRSPSPSDKKIGPQEADYSGSGNDKASDYFSSFFFNESANFTNGTVS